jgi:prepilin-type N-terminal cleavage/methylation domain-containing protein
VSLSNGACRVRGNGCANSLRIAKAVFSNPQSAIRNPQSSRGLTLLEVMVTMAIFLGLALFLFTAVQQVVANWTKGERLRVIGEKASGVFNVMRDDLRLALTREPAGATEVKIRFIGDVDKKTGMQRLGFVRSFESGPERALTFNSGNAVPVQTAYTLDEPDVPARKPKAPPPPPLQGNVEDFTGLKAGNFKPLGGMVMSGYCVKDQVLYRKLQAPVGDSFQALFDQPGQVLATDVLYLGFDYWSQATQSWDRQLPHSKIAGPDKNWDSTRGYEIPFSLHRGAISLNDPEDDVFPERVRITLTVDSPMPRCVYARLDRDIGEHEAEIHVDRAKGFDESEENAFILIDNEWIKFAKKGEDAFSGCWRGMRGTNASVHSAGALVRTGRTFRTVVYIPNYKEDFTSDKAYLSRRTAKPVKPQPGAQNQK